MAAPAKKLATTTYPHLAAYIEATGETQEQIAKQTGTTQAWISRIASGECVPRRKLALRLAAYARIPLGSFYEANDAYVKKHGAAA